MLVVWGRANSVNVQKVLWCCAEAGIAHERRDAGGPFGVVDTPEYRRINPNGLVPTIDDDGFTLWDVCRAFSKATCRNPICVA
jgi:glutathione S-transferase